MKTRLTLFLVVSLMLVAVLAPAVRASETETIVEVTETDGRFDTLAAGIAAAGLTDQLSGGDWTLFAPTDAAFAKLGITPSNIATLFDEDELADMLLYHVLRGEVSSDKALTLLGNITMANGGLAGLKSFRGDLWVNDDSKVVVEDIVAANGVIHAVDTLILPPWPRNGGEDTSTGTGGAASTSGSIVDIATANGRFDTLVAAIEAAGLTEQLSSGDWTLFAPTDAAFAELDLDADNIDRTYTDEELADLVLYHVIKGEMSSDKAKANLGDVIMANGSKAGLKYLSGNLWVNDGAKVVVEDIVATNGVIHIVDNVILGPWPR